MREAVGGVEFGPPDFLEGQALVAVEFHGVHGDVEVGVKNQAGLFHWVCGEKVKAKGSELKVLMFVRCGPESSSEREFIGWPCLGSACLTRVALPANA